LRDQKLSAFLFFKERRRKGKMTIREIIIAFMRDCSNKTATLKQIYSAVDDSGFETSSKSLHDTTRGIVYKYPKDFKRICKGVYMLAGENSASLLINGDGRKLEEIEDNSIDCIITDHPWEDKKANKGGNRKFAEYETFRYEPEDFKAKARVLKEGSYLVEFLPVESATNYKYLYEIKQMAEDAGLKYYTHCIWRNTPEGRMNTGKTTKGVQQIVIFSKGKPKKLSRPEVNAYQTREILNYEITMLLDPKKRSHQAEKPVELYEYLIRNLTEEHDICLDQFGGSCNMLKAAVNLNRFAIVYELAKDFVDNAVKRFGLQTLFDGNGKKDKKDEKENAAECAAKNAVNADDKIKASVNYLAEDDGQLSFAV